MLGPREPKEDGRAGTSEGAFTPGETVLVLDDVVTHADSKLEAIRVLEGNGLVVRDAAVLLDREQAGPGRLAAAGLHLPAPLARPQRVEPRGAARALARATA